MYTTQTRPAAGHVSFVCDLGDHDACDHPDCCCHCHEAQPVPVPATQPAEPEAVPVAQRTCRWTCDKATIAEQLLSGRSVPFSITQPDRRGRMTTVGYWLREILDRGLFRGWWVCNGENGEEYEIDPSFGHEARHAECSCPDYSWRGRDNGCCKHILAVWVLLERAGIDPTKGTQPAPAKRLGQCNVCGGIGSGEWCETPSCDGKIVEVRKSA